MTEYFFHKAEHEMAQTLAEILGQRLNRSLTNKGRGALILPGGKSPQALLRELARLNLPWKDFVVGATDERCVPIDSPDSNAGQIARIFSEEGTMLSPLHMTSVHEAEQLELPSVATVLGMGTDGHIASLFPGQGWFSSENKKAVLAQAPISPVERISLCYDTLQKTDFFVLLVSSPEKWEVCSRILDGQMPETALFKLLHEPKVDLQLHVAGMGK